VRPWTRYLISQRISEKCVTYLRGVDVCFVFKYLFDRERDREGENTSRESGEGEAGFLQSREPDAGLDPRIPGS